MYKKIILILGGLVAAVGVGFLAQPAFSQALSAKGIGAGGDLIRTVVPQAGNIFSVIDQVQDLEQEIIDCAQQGLFFDGTTCRNANPPQVRFRRTPDETYVDVQRAYPNTGTDTYALDGEDGTVTLLD